MLTRKGAFVLSPIVHATVLLMSQVSFACRSACEPPFSSVFTTGFASGSWAIAGVNLMTSEAVPLMTTGIGVGVGVGVGVRVGVGVGVRVGVGVGVTERSGVGVGVFVGFGVGVEAFTVGDGVGVGVCSMNGVGEGQAVGFVTYAME